MAPFSKHANNYQWNAHGGAVAATLVHDQQAFDSIDLSTHLNLAQFYWYNCKIFKVCARKKSSIRMEVN